MISIFPSPFVKESGFWSYKVIRHRFAIPDEKEGVSFRMTYEKEDSIF